jgi:RNA polymerase sigma factor (sigma-70 family)
MAVPEDRQDQAGAEATATGQHPSGAIPWEEVFDCARRVAIRFCSDGLAHLADDIAQEAAVRLLNNGHRIATNWQAFLYQITVNLARTHVKRERRRLRGIGRRGHEALLDESSSDPEVTSQVEAVELDERLEASLAELDIKFGLGTRAIVEFRAQKMTWKDIEDALSIPLRTCSDRHSRAVAWLRRQLSLPPRKGGDHE